jgi:GAF domain-containing protein
MRKDPSRLAELRRHLILDSPTERAYDDLTQLLAKSLGAPIAIVNLLDGERDWFKSCVGLPNRESSAETSFCETVFSSTEDVIIAEDTAADARFASHPLVVGAPHIRFYAAARLVVAGQTLGTLCAYDFQPRKISADQIEQLQALAAAVVELLKQRPAAA